MVSDGTRGGTRAEGKGGEDRGVCGKVEESTSGLLGGGGGKETSSGVKIQAIVTSRPKVVQSNTGLRSASRGTIAITIILACFILLPGVHASSNNLPRNNINQRVGSRIRAMSTKAQLFAQSLDAELSEKTSAQGLDGEMFAHNLVAGIVSSMCNGYFRGED